MKFIKRRVELSKQNENTEIQPGHFSGTPLVWLMEDSRLVRLYESFSYRTKAIPGKVHTAPAGFVFDGASVPRFFWRVIGSPLTGKYRWAAIIHDVLCHQVRDLIGTNPTQAKSLRVYTDNVFLEMMEVLGVSKIKRRLMYRGVRIEAWRLFRRAT